MTSSDTERRASERYYLRDVNDEITRFLSLIFMRDPWDGPDEFGVYDARAVPA
jgi:hypothetical protein